MNPDNFYFAYTINPDDDEPIMFIDRHVGYDEDDGYGIMGDVFQRELLMLDSMGKTRIQVWINSIGGIVLDGYAIYNAILKTKTKVDTYCFGLAASIAAVIFQAGRNRIMADYGVLMYHNPLGTDDNDALTAMRNSICKMIATRSGMSDEDVLKMMARESYIDAQEAMEMKLCDKIEASVDFNKKRLVPGKDTKAFWKEAATITNKLLPVKSLRKMKKVCNKLKLNEDAQEESILAEIDKIENKAKGAEDALEKKKKELEDKKDELKKKGEEYDKLKGEHDELKKEHDKLKKEAEDKAAADKTKAEAEEMDKAKNKVMAYVNAGKIKNEAKAIEKATKLAKERPEEFEELMGALPLNKTANKIEIPAGGGGNADKKPGSVIGAAMIKNSAKMWSGQAEREAEEQNK